MKTVLLTGAGGFIGAHTLAHVMHNTDWRLVALDSFRHKGLADRIVEMFRSHPEWKERVTVVTHDLRAPLSALTTREIGPVDYIINMASESHVDRSIQDPVAFVRNNVDLVLNMLEFARHRTIEAFIQISTDEVYGAAYDGQCHAEWSPIVPSNPYAASKAAQEAIAVSYWRTYDVPVVLTNTMNNIGEMQDPEKFVPNIIHSILAGRTVTIHGSDQSIGSRFYLHARNHADALLHILRNLAPAGYEGGNGARLPDRYNVVGEIEIDNLELAQAVASMMEEELNYKLVDFHAARPGHDRRYALNGEKLKRAGWVAPVAFHESLSRTVAWYLERKEWLTHV